MAITREKKEAQVKTVRKAFDEAKMTVLANYKGLSVAQTQELRAQLKDAGSKMLIVKNTLIQKAVVDKFKNLDISVFDGPMALVFGFEDEVAPAQVVADFARKNQLPEIMGAITAEGEYLSDEQTKRLATLPNKQQLLGQVVGTIAAPLEGMLRVLGGNLVNIVQVLNQYRDQRI